MNGWLLLLATAVGAALGGIAYKLGEEYFPNLRASFESRFGAATQLEQLFESGGSARTDLCLFTATARKFMPLTDVLYFEFLRHLLISGQTQELLLGRWHPVQLTEIDGERESWADYDDYVDSLFAEFGPRVSLVFGREILYSSQGQLPPLFWKALADIGAGKHLDWAPTIGLSRRRYRRLARTKAGDMLRGTVAHAMNNTELVPHLASILDRVKSNTDRRPSLGILFWELEVDRLAVFQALYLASDRGNGSCPAFDLNPIAGRTIRARFGRVSNNHSEDRSISLVSSAGDTIRALSQHDRREIKQYRSFVAAVLRANYSFAVARSEWQQRGDSLMRSWKITDGAATDLRLTKSRLELLFLLTQLREEHQAMLRSYLQSRKDRLATDPQGVDGSDAATATKSDAFAAPTAERIPPKFEPTAPASGVNKGVSADVEL